MTLEFFAVVAADAVPVAGELSLRGTRLQPHASVVLEDRSLFVFDGDAYQQLSVAGTPRRGALGSGSPHLRPGI